MTHHSPAQFASIPVDAGRQVAQLRHVLRLVEALAGRGTAPDAADAALDEAARLSSAYDQALPIVRRRFDCLVGETAKWSAAAVEALLQSGGQAPPAAARRLADELGTALNRLTALLLRQEDSASF
jgi:hypothetical protein